MLRIADIAPLSTGFFFLMGYEGSPEKVVDGMPDEVLRCLQWPVYERNTGKK